MGTKCSTQTEHITENTKSYWATHPVEDIGDSTDIDHTAHLILRKPLSKSPLLASKRKLENYSSNLVCVSNCQPFTVSQMSAERTLPDCRKKQSLEEDLMEKQFNSIRPAPHRGQDEPCKITIQCGNFISLREKDIKDRYQFMEKIGEGAFGRVFKALTLPNKEVRAIKIISGEYASNHEQELEILKECDHPNIVRLYEAYVHENYLYVAMEYCQGGSGAHYLKLAKDGDKGREWVRFITDTVQQMLQAVAYLHSKNIVHLDIKLENIVFLDNSKGGTRNILKIIDFGIAKKIKFKFNKSPRKVGTICYMPPEAFEGWYSPATDIWSCGVMFYTLITGKNPFRGKTVEETKALIRQRPIEFKQQNWNYIDPSLKRLVQQMLNRDFRKRISAGDCLKTPCLAIKRTVSRINSACFQVNEQVRKQYFQNNFVSMIESYLSYLKISHSQKRDVMELFELFDTDKKGTISKEDLTEAYRRADVGISEDEIIDLMDRIDKNKSGKIDFSEFEAFMVDRKTLFVKEFLSEAFDFFDSDQSGFIERKELQSLLKDCKEDIGCLLAQVDENKDERISKEEFLAYFNRIAQH